MSNFESKVYDDLLNRMEELVFILDALGSILYVNRSAVDLLGYSEAELLSMNMLELHPIENREEVIRIVKAMVEEGLELCRIPLQTRTGKLIPVETHVRKGEWHGHEVLIGISKNMLDIMNANLKFSKSFISNPSVMAITDLESGLFIDVNESFLSSLDYKRAEVVGKTVYDLNFYSDFKDRETIVSEVSKFGYIRNHEMKIRSSKGELITGIFSADKVFINDREYLLSVMKDITERTKMENAFQQSQMRLKLATEGAQIGLWDWHVKTGQTFFDEQWANIIGYTLEELEPISIDTWVKNAHPDDLKKSDQLIMDHFSGLSDYYEHEARMRHKDGRWIWVMDRGRVIERDDEGNPERMVGTHIDITARKETENALIEERKLFTGGPTLVFLWRNAEGWPAEYVSSNVMQVLGYTVDEILAGSPAFSELIHQEDLDRLIAEVRDNIENERDAFEQIYRMRCSDGRIRWFQDYTVIKRNEEGEVTHFHGYMNDITDRKMAEEAAMQLKEIAEKSNLMKSQFLANMSHEIRTPMNGIIGYLKLLGVSALNQEQQDLLKEAQNASDTLLYLLNDILDFSKIEAGKVSVEQAEFQLKGLVSDTLHLFLPKARDKGIQLLMQMDSDLPEKVVGDSTRVRQILSNLIGNAVKFTEEGQIVVKVTANRRLDAKKLSLVFEVQDTGVGMDRETMDMLFRPFTQADASTTRKYGGTGLGLAISKELAKLMGGDILVKSSLGKGSRFTLTVEIEEAVASAVNHENYDIEIGNLGVQPSTNPSTVCVDDLRILLVDDSEMNQRLIQKVLAGQNMSCELAGNGVEALEKMAQKEFDLILMDCQMPVMDGYQCSLEIRKREGDGLRIPIIAMTANAMGGDRQKCMEAQMDDYLTKPVDFEKLFDLLKQYGGIIRRQKDEYQALNPVVQNWKGFGEEKKTLMFQSGLDAETVEELYEDFLEKLMEKIPLLYKMIDQNEMKELKAEAHQIKGTAANLSLTRISRLALDLEGALTQNSRDLSQILLGALEQLLRDNR